MSEQDKQDLIGFVLVDGVFNDNLLSQAADDLIRRVGVVNVLSWVATKDSRRKFARRILDRCERIAREDEVCLGLA